MISIRWGGKNAKGESQVGFSYLYSGRLITCYFFFLWGGGVKEIVNCE